MATTSKSRKMVNGVPMATVYRGMSIHRLEVLMSLFVQADTDCDDLYDGDGSMLEERFQQLCERAARKAEYNMKPKTASKRKVK